MNAEDQTTFTIFEKQEHLRTVPSNHLDLPNYFLADNIIYVPEYTAFIL